jgi:hypothetical protein
MRRASFSASVASQVLLQLCFDNCLLLPTSLSPSHPLYDATTAMPSATLPTSRLFVTQLLNSLPFETVSTTESNPLSAVPEAAKKQLLSLQVLFPNEFLPALDLLDRRLVTRLRIGDDQELLRQEAVGQETVQAGEDGEATPTNGPIGEEVGSGMNSPTLVPAEKLTTTTQIAPSITEDRIMTDTVVSSLYDAALNIQDTIYYVRSAQQRSSRYSTSYDTTTSYEVRLCAWNCSCPAFAFAAYPAVYPEPDVPGYDPLHEETQARLENEDWKLDRKWAFGGVSLGEGIPPVCKHLLACVLAERVSGLFCGFVEERVVSVEEAAGWAAGWGD